ncbi:MAG: cation transporter [Gammaproteobacteria bacterium]|jgi:multicomponent Na+:H+ antiporter subunit E|nr:cation transporter [Gammaproteobacteria bacterium]
MPAAGMIPQLARLLGRFAVFWGVWWLLTDGRADGLVFGAAFAAVAAAMPLVIVEPRGTDTPLALLPTVLRGLLLLPFFLWQSLYGGIDVAARAFKPRLPLTPTLFDYRLRLPPGPAPVMLASLVSLMPGTLAIVSGARLRVHVLDAGRDYQDELELLEAQVAWIFGVALQAPRTPAPTRWVRGPETDA